MFVIKIKQKKVFLAFLLSSFCIFLFSLLGLCLAENALYGNTFIEAIKVNFNSYLSYIIFSLLIISAISTLDSTLSSAAKLIVIDLAFFSTNNLLW